MSAAPVGGRGRGLLRAPSAPSPAPLAGASPGSRTGQSSGCPEHPAGLAAGSRSACAAACAALQQHQAVRHATSPCGMTDACHGCCTGCSCRAQQFMAAIMSGSHTRDMRSCRPQGPQPVGSMRQLRLTMSPLQPQLKLHRPKVCRKGGQLLPRAPLIYSRSQFAKVLGHASCRKWSKGYALQQGWACHSAFLSSEFVLPDACPKKSAYIWGPPQMH